MGTFRPVERLELALDAEGRPTLEDFRPRKPHRLDSLDYPGLGLTPAAWEEIVTTLRARRRVRQMNLW